MSSKTQQKKPEMCCECGIQIGVVHGMCNHQHLFCRKCTEKSFKRGSNNGWYKQYILWCDSCIWFDIG